MITRQEDRAGEKLFVDFPGQRLPIYDRAIRRGGLMAELFVGVFGALDIHLIADNYGTHKTPRSSAAWRVTQDSNCTSSPL